MEDFISKFNVYNYKNPKSNDENSRYVTEVQTMTDGSKCKIKKDLASGISVISVMDAKKKLIFFEVTTLLVMFYDLKLIYKNLKRILRR